MAAYFDDQQYPHVRAMKTCLACGRAKIVGELVCWPCNNHLKIVHDGGYGPDVDRVIRVAEVLRERLDRE